MSFLADATMHSPSRGAALARLIVVAALLTAAACVRAQPGTPPATTAYGELQALRGAATSLSIGRDGSVWAIDPGGALYLRALGATSWSRRADGVAVVAAIDQDSAWLLSTNGESSLLGGGNRRAQSAPLARDVAVGVDGSVLLATLDGALLVNREGVWIDGEFPRGLARRVALDEHALPWVINEAAQLHRFDGTQWRSVATDARGVSINANGVVVVTDLSGRTFSWDVANQRWLALEALAAVPTQGTFVAPDGALWSVGVTGEITRLLTIERAPAATAASVGAIARPPATFTKLLQWRTMRGRGQSISVSPGGLVIAIDAEGTAHRYQGRGQWSIYPGRFSAMVGAADQSLWALRQGGVLMRSVRGVWADVPAMPLTALAPEAKGAGLWALTPDGSVVRFSAPAFTATRIAAPSARQLSVDESNNVWLLDGNGDLWRAAAPTTVDANWQRVSFGGIKAKSIAGGAGQSAYAVAANEDIYWFDPREGLFKPANGRATTVALGPRDALWAMTASGDILASAAALLVETGTSDASAAPPPDLSKSAAVSFVARPETTRKPLQFRQVAGTAGDIGVSAFGAVFATGAESGVNCFSPNLQVFLPVLSGAARRIAVSPDRDVWIVESSGRVTLFKTGTNAGASLATPITASDVAVAVDGAVFLVGTDERVFRRVPVDGSFEPVALSANGFNLSAHRVSAVSRNLLWVANKSGGLWRCNNGACVAQTVGAKDVAVGPEGSVLVVDSAANLDRQVGAPSAAATNAVSTFERVGPGNVANVSVGPQGLPWIVNAAGNVFTAEPLPSTTSAASGGAKGNDFCQTLAASAVTNVAGSAALPTTLPIVSIIARPDSATLSRGGTFDLLANDNVGAARASAGGNVRFALLSSDLPTAAISTGGVVSIPGNQLPGSYNLRYSICATPQGQPCASSSATITVAAPTFVATVVDDVATLARGGTFNLLANDTIDGRAVLLGVNASFSAVSSTLPTTAIRDGVVTIAADQAAGSYVVRYQLCGLLAGQGCAAATASITVTPPQFSAMVVDDNATLLRGASFDLLANDRVAGAPVVIGGNARFVLLGNALPATSVVAGVVTIAADQAIGVYAIRYQLCGLIAGQNCVDGNAVITVIVPPFVAIVAPDNFTVVGGASRDLLANDSVNGKPVSLGVNARLEVLSSALPASAIDRFGIVTVATGQAPGVYSIRYQLCGLASGQGCVATTSTITVVTVVPPFVAVVNPENVSLQGGQSVNLLGNDSVGGNAVALGSNASFNVTATSLPTSAINATGVLTVPTAQPRGVYSVSYQLCGLLAGQSCVGTTSAITVIAPAFVAVAAPDNVTLQATQSINLLANDSVGGIAVSLGNNASFSVTATTLPQSAISASGVLTVPTGQPEGQYSVSYQLCGLLAGQGCVATTSTITVITTVPIFVAVVNPENVSLQPTQAVNLLFNDTVAGLQVALGSNASFNVISTTLPASAISAAGVLTVPSGQAPGVYTVNYRLCGLLVGQGCVATISTITVLAAIPQFVAVVNPDNVSLQAGQSVNLLSNDTVGGSAVTLGLNARFELLATTLPASAISSAGVVIIPVGQVVGSYSVSYRLCGLISGQGCVGTTSTITVVVLVAPFVAVANADNVTLEQTRTVNLLANDTVAGGAVVLGSNASFAVVGGTLPGASISASGVVTVAPALAPGTYTVNYQLCGLLAGQGCVATTSSITVVPLFVAVVNGESISTESPGGVFSLIANDTVSGLAVNIGVNANFVEVSSSLPVASYSTTGGALQITLAIAPGSYSINYRLCGVIAGQGCFAAIATINVVTPFVAVMTGETASLRPFETLNLLANDTVSGGAVAVGVNASFSVLSSGAIAPAAISANGVLTIPAAQPIGGSSIVYSLCGLIAGQTCRQATAVINVLAPWAGVAVSNSAVLNPGATLDPLLNDTVNGASAVHGVNALFERRPYVGVQTEFPVGAVSASGIVTMPLFGGVYVMTYRICGLFAGQGCSADVDVVGNTP